MVVEGADKLVQDLAFWDRPNIDSRSLLRARANGIAIGISTEDRQPWLQTGNLRSSQGLGCGKGALLPPWFLSRAKNLILSV